MSLVEEKLVAEAFPLLTFINEVGPAVDFFVFTSINILENFALREAHIAIDTASSVKTLFKDWLKAGRFGLRRGNSEMFHNLVARAFPESTIDGDLSVAASIVLTDAGGDIPVLAGLKARNLGRVIIEAHVGTIPLVFAAWRFKTKDLFHDSVALTFEKLSVVVDLNVAADLLERASVVLNPVVAGLKESLAFKQIHTVSWANLIDSALFGAVESTVASEEHVHNVVTGSFNHLAVNLTTNLAVQFTIAILHFPEQAGLETIDNAFEIRHAGHGLTPVEAVRVVIGVVVGAVAEVGLNLSAVAFVGRTIDGNLSPALFIVGCFTHVPGVPVIALLKAGGVILSKHGHALAFFRASTVGWVLRINSEHSGDVVTSVSDVFAGVVYAHKAIEVCVHAAIVGFLDPALKNIGGNSLRHHVHAIVLIELNAVFVRKVVLCLKVVTSVFHKRAVDSRNNVTSQIDVLAPVIGRVDVAFSDTGNVDIQVHAVIPELFNALGYFVHEEVFL
jgi:hypothetical protein